MKKKFVLSFFLFSAMWAQAQVGIHTGNPQGAFHVDAGRDNPETGAPSAAQQANDFIVTAPSGFVGIGTTTPTHKLHVIGDGVSDPVSFSTLNTGNVKDDYLLGITSTGVVKSLGGLEGLSVPLPALFVLNNDIDDFLSTQATGESQAIPMTSTKNSISNLVFTPATNQITLPSGVYEISLTYEAVHDSPGCTLSSYYVDFPGNTTPVKVQNNAPHIEGGLGIHGGTISYTTKLTNTTNNLTIHLGRGQAGNCTGTGMKLLKNSTHLLIYKIGN
ncbi:hypothetical protein VUJ46_08725 [Chryseobacterium sp. MYb264]|uniref:hypothetical protein n=1 Tax=Chryseobacterium sp. MYb264 TaxID=2745153 RepID=UPI002E1308A9|nr:hypothetical protein VUJ46_08725 [Chryseobacterium sp. MYb264]